MDLQTIFKRLGLPKHAHEIYTVLQKNGQMSITDLSAATSVHRPAVYSALRDLLKHRFVVTVSMGKRKVYQAAPLHSIVQEFSKVSEKVFSKIEKLVIPSAYEHEHVRILKGRKGITEAFDDVIEHTPRGGTFYRYTSEKDLDRVNSYLSNGYRTGRDAKKLERLVISNPESGSQKRSRLERFIKYIPKENSLFDQDVIQTIYGNRIAFIDLNKEEAMIIENKAIAEFQKVIFLQLYKKLG